MAEARLPKRLVAVVNVVGPDGDQVDAGQPIPADWPEVYRRALYETGGARRAGR